MTADGMDTIKRVMREAAQTIERLDSERDNYRTLYHELLHTVESTHHGETRHQTALRYLRERAAAERCVKMEEQ